MPSTFFGLTIAYSGLLASNAAQNTAANNIANVETKGYSRQQVKQQAANALRVFQKYGCAGAGVETLGKRRHRRRRSIKKASPERERQRFIRLAVFRETLSEKTRGRATSQNLPYSASQCNRLPNGAPSRSSRRPQSRRRARERLCGSQCPTYPTRRRG